MLSIGSINAVPLEYKCVVMSNVIPIFDRLSYFDMFSQVVAHMFVYWKNDCQLSEVLAITWLTMQRKTNAQITTYEIYIMHAKIP